LISTPQKKGATQRPLLALPLSGSSVDLDREVVDALDERILDFRRMPYGELCSLAAYCTAIVAESLRTYGNTH
jgi:hypothetical protein